jgi:hypothetical protein
MTSHRIRQINHYDNNSVLSLDQVLIEFVKVKQVKTMLLQGDSDTEYFIRHLPDCQINKTGPGPLLLAIFYNHPRLNFEQFLNHTVNTVNESNPQWIYIAINKYLVSTQHTWPNLTDNYDADLLDIVKHTLSVHHYCELTRSYIDNDTGQYFNFAHPTTNAYYENIKDNS